MKAAAIFVFALALGLVTAGCSSGTGASTTPAGADFNHADVTFASQMVPHHQQAVQMSELVASRTTTPALVDLAKRISAAQQPEINQMNAWLDRWGARNGHRAMPEMHEMPGMQSDADMAKLTAATEAEFDRLWLAMMIDHHEGAIEMSKTEQAQGRNDEAKRLASEIIKTQQAEIDEMTRLQANA